MAPEQLALIRETRAARPRCRGPSRGPGGGPRWPRSCPSRGCWSTRACCISTSTSTTPCPRSWTRTRSPGCGCGCGSGPGAHRVREGRREGGRLIDGFLVERRRRVRLLRAAGRARPGRLARAGARPGAARARAGRRRPVRGEPRRCAPARRAAAQRPRRGAALAGAAAAARPRRSRAAGRGTGGGRRSWRRSRAAVRPGPCGPRCPGPQWAGGARAGRRRDARLRAGRAGRRARRAGRGAGRRRADRAAGGGAARAAHRRRRAREAVPAVARRAARVACGPSSGPGPRCSPPCRTSGWSPSGTTATPATASRTPRSPHAREVLLLRAAQDRCGFLLGSYELHRRGRPARGERLGPAAGRRPRAGPRAPRRWCGPSGDGELARDEAARAARLPSLAWQTVREGLKQRTGAGAGAPAGLRAAAGLRALPDARPLPALRRAAGGARTSGDLRVRLVRARGDRLALRRSAGVDRLRAQVVGARRTAEELGRAFPAVPVRTSGRDHVLDTVPGRARARREHPRRRARRRGRVRGGAAARRLGHARAARSAGGGGRAAPLDRRGLAGTRAERRAARWSWSPSRRCGPCRRWCAGTRSGTRVRELAERAELGFPPVSRMAAVSGPGGGGRRVSGGGRAAGRTPRCWARCRCRSPRPGQARAGRATRRRGSSGSGRWSGCRRAAGRRWPPR